MERRKINQIMNDIDEKQKQMNEIGIEVAKVTRNADSHGYHIRCDFIDQMRKLLDELDDLNEELEKW